MQRLPPDVRRLAAVLAAVALLPGPAALAGSGDVVYHLTRHGDPSSGVMRDPLYPRGHCMHCHITRQVAPFSFPFILFRANDNGLCFTCHAGATAAGVYQGQTPFESTLHWSSGRMLWPGPVPAPRPAGDEGKCLNCHTPHGVRDGSGLVPDQGYVREEALCLACHDASGPAAANIAAELAKASAHPVIAISGRHAAGEGGTGAPYGGAGRHAECADCHNPHRANASQRLAGVGRVAVSNGAAGTLPAYTWLGPLDASPIAEYQLCFKCHSSFTTLPAGARDKGLELNPANESFHPVEGPGRNTSAAMAASLAGGTGLPHLGVTGTVTCGDCHNSEALPLTVSTAASYTGAAPLGPHGSAAAAGNAALSNQLVRAAYRAQLKPRASSNDYSQAEFALCMICHAPAPFADGSKNNRSDTNFPLHGFHLTRLYADPAGGATGTIDTPGAGQGNAICRECHYNIHGTRTAFYSGNRTNARLVSFSPNITGPGGTGAPSWAPRSCQLRCHGMNHSPETY